MKNKINLFVFAFFITINGCSKDLYQVAKEVNTVESYDKYLASSPVEPGRTEALKTREILYYIKMVEKSQEVRGDDVFYRAGFLDSYLIEYPNGQFVDGVNKLREKNWFEQVQKARDVELCDTYVVEYPQGIYLEQVNQLKENLTFEKAKEAETAGAFDTYFLRYPQGLFVEKAKELEEKNWYKRAEEENSHKGYLIYFEEYPQGKFVRQVKGKIELLDYHKAKTSNSIQYFDLFLKEYPDSKFFPEIKELRNGLWINKASSRVPFIKGAEVEAWEFTKNMDNIYQYNWFIRNFPKSGFIQEAKKRRQEKHISNQKLRQ
ncbi:MAG: hypothetical protein GY786_07420 [Proteobacteria bacterium]|nr:hypothetical protein [Pseudomonadota bacterium]